MTILNIHLYAQKLIKHINTKASTNGMFEFSASQDSPYPPLKLEGLPADLLETENLSGSQEKGGLVQCDPCVHDQLRFMRNFDS